MSACRATTARDARFRKALNAISTRVEMKRLYLILYGREDIPDASTVDYGRKDSEYYTANHPEVRALLHDGIAVKLVQLSVEGLI